MTSLAASLFGEFTMVELCKDGNSTTWGHSGGAIEVPPGV